MQQLKWARRAIEGSSVHKGWFRCSDRDGFGVGEDAESIMPRLLRRSGRVGCVPIPLRRMMPTVFAGVPPGGRAFSGLCASLPEVSIKWIISRRQ
jgi:hypothetical protein